MDKKTAESDARQLQADQFREALGNAYAFVESQKVAQTFAAYTPEDAMDAFITLVTGPDTPSRPNVLNRITKIQSDVLAAIAQIQATPDDAFRSPDDTKDVNTDAEPPQ